MRHQRWHWQSWWTHGWTIQILTFKNTNFASTLSIFLCMRPIHLSDDFQALMAILCAVPLVANKPHEYVSSLYQESGETSSGLQLLRFPNHFRLLTVMTSEKEKKKRNQNKKETKTKKKTNNKANSLFVISIGIFLYAFLANMTTCSPGRPRYWVDFWKQQLSQQSVCHGNNNNELLVVRTLRRQKEKRLGSR